MRFSASEILPVARANGFNAEVVEKVFCLMHLLNALSTHPSLKGRWVLKGGTALNLFVLRHPRLSVDIDLNYIGALEREEMLEERPRIDVSENWVATTFARQIEHAASQEPDKSPASTLQVRNLIRSLDGERFIGYGSRGI